MLDGACVACCLAFSTGSYHRQLARHISPIYCSDDEKVGWKFVHFDVLDSKMQEFGLNETTCWRICSYTSKRSHFTLSVRVVSSVAVDLRAVLGEILEQIILLSPNSDSAHQNAPIPIPHFFIILKHPSWGARTKKCGHLHPRPMTNNFPKWPLLADFVKV